MPNSEDIEERKLTTRLFFLIVTAVIIIGGLLFFVVSPMLAEHLEPGIGLKDAALIAFAATLVVIVIMAVAAGDGLLGEIQFMIAGFGGFFVIFWLMIAWIF